MLKLIHAFNMNFDNVINYYNSFKDESIKDVNCYAISLANSSYEEYYNWVFKYEKNLYYLVDTSNEDYILGFGTIEYSPILDYHKEYLNIGNIAYGIRPNERNKGYGTKLLKLLLEKCEMFNMTEVCVSCNKGNIASKKVILNNGGIYEKDFYDDFEGPGQKYWINIKPKMSTRAKKLLKRLIK